MLSDWEWWTGCNNHNQFKFYIISTGSTIRLPSKLNTGMQPLLRTALNSLKSTFGCCVTFLGTFNPALWAACGITFPAAELCPSTLLSTNQSSGPTTSSLVQPLLQPHLITQQVLYIPQILFCCSFFQHSLLHTIEIVTHRMLNHHTCIYSYDIGSLNTCSMLLTIDYWVQYTFTYLFFFLHMWQFINASMPFCAGAHTCNTT